MRRFGIAAAVLLLAAMVTILLLGLIPHSARGAELQTLSYKQTLTKVKAATKAAPVFVIHQTDSGQPLQALYVDRPQQLLQATVGTTRVVLSGNVDYGWTAKTKCWSKSVLAWKQLGGGVTAWNAIDGPIYSADGKHTVSAHQLLEVYRQPAFLTGAGRASWYVDRLTFASSWRVTEHFVRLHGSSATSGGNSDRYTLSYPQTLPAWVKVPTSDFCSK